MPQRQVNRCFTLIWNAVFSHVVDTIVFRDTGEDIGVRILINGRELIDLVRDVELPFATREGHPKIAGAYSYFGPSFTFLPSRHFLGQAVHSWTDGEGRCYVLSCHCGIPPCWPLSTRIEVRQQEIIWSDFRQVHRGPQSAAGEWRYDGMGPFVFNRESYERALAGNAVPRVRMPRKRSENTRLTEVFNLAFRRGANDRAAAGIVLPASPPSPGNIPSAPEDCTDMHARAAWSKGYSAGFQCGASDSELAGVDEPGAHGMISGFDQDFLERYGLLDGTGDHLDKLR